MDGDAAPPVGPTRRQVLATAGASALALTACTALAEPPEVARGIVFEDLDGTGRHGRTNRGIAQMMVSNGRDVVVRTDAEGR